MDDQILDPNEFQLERTPRYAERKIKRVEPYLRGPIPWEWLQRAMAAGPAALTAGLAVWHYRALKKSTTFALSLQDIAKITHRSESVARRGIAALIAAGLIERTQDPGRKPRITLK